MNKKFKEFKKAVGDHPRLFVLCLVIILIFIMLIIFRIADKYMNKNVIIEEKFYSFIASEKVYFDSEVNINRKKVISDVKPEVKINLSSSPIFSQKRILFPKEMIIVLPEENYMLFKLYSYTYLDKSSDNILTKKFNQNLDDYVIYDGEDTYFFSDKGTLKVGNTEIELSKYSVVWCQSNKVKYYNYGKEVIDSLEMDNTVIFESQNYIVDLKNDTIGSEQVLLPKDTKYLDLISEY